MKAMTIKGIDEDIYKRFKAACAEQDIDMKASVLQHMENILSGRTLKQMHDEIISALKEKFVSAELSMLLDIFNSTALMSGMLGQHIIAQVEDSFAEYPGMYEQKWGVDRDMLVKKCRELSQVQAAVLEVWAVAFWQDGHYEGKDSAEQYIK